MPPSHSTSKVQHLRQQAKLIPVPWCHVCPIDDTKTWVHTKRFDTKQRHHSRHLGSRPCELRNGESEHIVQRYHCSSRVLRYKSKLHTTRPGTRVLQEIWACRHCPRLHTSGRSSTSCKAPPMDQAASDVDTGSLAQRTVSRIICWAPSEKEKKHGQEPRHRKSGDHWQCGLPITSWTASSARVASTSLRIESATIWTAQTTDHAARSSCVACVRQKHRQVVESPSRKLQTSTTTDFNHWSTREQQGRTNQQHNRHMPQQQREPRPTPMSSWPQSTLMQTMWLGTKQSVIIAEHPRQNQLQHHQHSNHQRHPARIHHLPHYRLRVHHQWQLQSQQTQAPTQRQLRLRRQHQVASAARTLTRTRTGSSARTTAEESVAPCTIWSQYTTEAHHHILLDSHYGDHRQQNKFSRRRSLNGAGCEFTGRWESSRRSWTDTWSCSCRGKDEHSPTEAATRPGLCVFLTPVCYRHFSFIPSLYFSPFC